MLIRIRRGVFETNSSSTHSLTICTKEEWDAWLAGKLLFDRWNETFVPAYGHEDDEDAQTYEQWCADYDYSHYKSTYETKSGDVIVVFGKYGYNG